MQAAVTAAVGTSPPSITLHRGEAVTKKAQALNADAYTHEGAVHIPGTTPLASDKSRQLLAHELTHVVQQQQYGKNMPPEHTPLGRQLEASALHAESLVASPPSALPLATPRYPELDARSAAATDPVTQPDLTLARAGGQNRRGNGMAPQEVKLNPEHPRPAEVVLSPRRLATVAAAEPTRQLMPGQPTWSSRTGGGASQLDPGSTSQPGAPQPTQTIPAGAPEQVQRKARAQGHQQPSAKPEAARVKPRREPAPQVEAAAAQPTSFVSDARWLEQHANALYPLIRNMLRADLLKDRERRSKLMREY
ncbi:hypothetical protein LBMAG15_19040 [Actinomycetes bacterium]|nr:hypothetical protein LBMAG15_19040 [Actinomycetes bacterium]